METLAYSVSPNNLNISSSNSQTMLHLNKDDLKHMLLTAASTPDKGKLVCAAVSEFYRNKYPFSTPELVPIQENLSGIRLMEAMRKKLPGLLPPVRQERKFTDFCQDRKQRDIVWILIDCVKP